MIKMHKIFSRFIHTNNLMKALDKGALAKLRRKTGYSIANCRKALDQNDNNIEEAETWLHKQAKSEGWAKIASLAERVTAHGLVGVHIDGNRASIVEVNCETDFVARTEKFATFVQHTAKTCLQISPTAQDKRLELVKKMLSSEQMASLEDEEGRSLADSLALIVGSMKENMKLNRASIMTSSSEINLVGRTHPHSTSLTGKYGTILAFKNPNENEEITKQLCLHVIGMNPLNIGTEEDMKAACESKVSNDPESESSSSSDESSSSSDEDGSSSSDEESAPTENENTILVHQQFIADENMNVGQVLKEHNIEILDFIRFQCGEVKTEE